jgi:hypothetical protein
MQESPTPAYDSSRLVGLELEYDSGSSFATNVGVKI